jgi:hypothetical protein
MSVKQQITAQFTDALDKAVSVATLKKAADKMGKEAVEIMRERTGRNLDVNYNSFKEYSKKYAAFKKRYIAGGGGAKTRRNIGAQTKYKAKKVNDKMRLSGKLFSDMTYTVTQNAKFSTKFSLSFRLFIAQRSAKKAEGLIKRGYRFFGISSSGSKGRQEQERLFAAANKIIKAELQNKTIQLK